MAKRFIDSDLFKKPLMRGIKAPYKLLWVYIFCDCNHAGIWEYDPDVADIRLGQKINWKEAEKVLEKHIKIIDNGARWFIPEFISFQYSKLSETNPAHRGVIFLLKRHHLINETLEIDLKGHQSPFEGATVGTMDMVKEKEKDVEKDKGGVGEIQKNEHPLQQFVQTLDLVKKLRDQLTKEQAEKLIKDFGEQKVRGVLEAMQNRKDLIKKYVSVYLTCKKWCENNFNQTKTHDITTVRAIHNADTPKDYSITSFAEGIEQIKREQLRSQ